MNQLRSITPEDKKQPHWTDVHIQYDESIKKYIAYDETGDEYGRYQTYHEARDSLILYAIHML